ncbi:TetR/AcrR family transcriptional regulator [Pseudomonas putida]|uniref:TetR/AcrR family transcriptional regulator n=1 Tax=Pseudomonas putida TaxID=303 RepID=UPI0015762990|nr:TetR/AcrR family transcriptional regulator [Pseudomonas putida]NTY90376.1 TetR/AcrR family transcriptional regulator [Pseudomonas putida]NTY98918.1 TetR/AcrR family transcriptional regulator [Pseudomonas putida]NTZ21201.1 TetR/AcrR family transcriptional regulator [Pseudomonas putida]NTZ53280.1 TetR/AcrR family transcriptional regulator [Pseudomonas putida]NTZ65070.1 TetR/AcrR family transcriptional regulator [Pseudomonas putida]
MSSKDLSATAGRIAQLALNHFAERGYDAASMNDIAALAGLKKASLYAHFESKDALYLTSLEIALESEIAYVRAHFAHGEKASDVPGEGYWSQLRDRYTQNDSLRFLLRAAFYPPHALRREVMSGFDGYLEVLRGCFTEACVVGRQSLLVESENWLVEAYMAVIDSLTVELIYGNDDGYRRRIEAFSGLYRWASKAATAKER